MRRRPVDEIRAKLRIIRGSRRSLRNPVGFALRELFAERSVATYRLRRSPTRIVIRHGTSDPKVFHEIFNKGEYDALLFGLMPEDTPHAPKIVDLGAHVGLFSARAGAAFPNGRITSVEPDARNVAILHKCADLNAGRQRWTIVEAAADVRNGTTALIEDGSWVSRVEGVGTPPSGLEGTSPRRVEIPTVDALELMDGADFVKIDIEGSEWALLDDPRFREIEATRVCIEYHAWSSPHDDAHAAATTRLEEAGYRVTTLHRGPIDGTLLALKAT